MSRGAFMGLLWYAGLLALTLMGVVVDWPSFLLGLTGAGLVAAAACMVGIDWGREG